MNVRMPLSAATHWEHQLLAFSALVAVVSLAFAPFEPEPLLATVSEMLLPLGISVCIGLFAVRLRHRGFQSDQLRRIVACGWAGALVSAVISVWWIAFHLHGSMPVAGLADQILTVVSGSVGAGLLVGRSRIDASQENPSTDRTRVLSETSWTGRSTGSPILAATVEAMAELEDADPAELEPLYDHVDPDILGALRAQDDSHWQFRFYTGEYEVRVSSVGTVTVYDDTAVADTQLTDSHV